MQNQGSGTGKSASGSAQGDRAGQPINPLVAAAFAAYNAKNRNPLDVVGRANDLINGYIAYFGSLLSVHLPEILAAVVVIIVMLIAARELIKE